MKMWTRPRRLPWGGRGGKLTGVAALVEASSLGPAAKQLVIEVCRRSRLWTSERSDLARELIAHFTDAAAAGITEAEAVGSFGDPKSAARLIRRATVRKRPLAWKAWIRAWQAVACLALLAVAVLLWTTVRFVTLSPRITRNYAAEINAKMMAVPESERAWPLYREALGRLGALGAFPVVPLEGKETRQPLPGEPLWPDMRAYLDRAKPAFDLLAQASSRPMVGYPYSSEVEPSLADAIALFNGETPAPGSAVLLLSPGASEENPSLISVILPPLSPMRRVAVLLTESEMYAAIQDSDGPRAERAITTTIGIGRQFSAGGTLIEQLVGYALMARATQAVERLLAVAPGLLDDAAVVRLMHAFAAATPSGRFVLDLSTERLTMHDAAQRMYSDNGNGDGILTLKGFREFLGPATHVAGDEAWQAFPVPGLVAGRRSTVEEWDRLFDEFSAAAAAGPEELASAEQAFRRIDNPGNWVATYPVIRVLLPSFQRAIHASKECTMRRDAALVGLALELYRRRNGSYPASIGELSPGLLPVVPIDAYSGRPLCYEVVDGRPRLYSVWRDGVDDKGAQDTKSRNSGPGQDFRLWGFEEVPKIAF